MAGLQTWKYWNSAIIFRYIFSGPHPCHNFFFFFLYRWHNGWVSKRRNKNRSLGKCDPCLCVCLINIIRGLSPHLSIIVIYCDSPLSCKIASHIWKLCLVCIYPQGLNKPVYSSRGQNCNFLRKLSCELSLPHNNVAPFHCLDSFSHHFAQLTERAHEQ